MSHSESPNEVALGVFRSRRFGLFISFQRGYFGFIVQCKVEGVSKRGNIQQSVRFKKAYQTQSSRYYGTIEQEANNHPDVYAAALYYLLKDCVKYKTFYVSLSTKRKRSNGDDDGDDREPKKPKTNHQFYSWKKRGSSFERQLKVILVDTADNQDEPLNQTEANDIIQQHHKCCNLL